MQRSFLPAILFTMFLYCSCREQKPKTPIQHAKDSAQAQTFFPVTEYIRGQLSEIDSLPVTPLKIVTYNGNQDSTWMKKQDIRPFAEPFLNPEIDTSNLKDLFTEKSFLDQTINAFTFSYDPSGELPDTLQLRRWDVYIDPKKNTITRIYIIKEINNSGGMQTQQLTWRSNKWCKITTIIEQEGKQPEIKEEIMKWDLNE